MVLGDGWISDDSSFYGTCPACLVLPSIALSHSLLWNEPFQGSSLDMLSPSPGDVHEWSIYQSHLLARTSQILVENRYNSETNTISGDETEQERLDALCEEFRPAYAFSMRKNDLNAIVFKHCKAHCTAPLRNPGEGNPASWQLGETVEKFVRRLPPATTSINLHKWIWVYNPFEEKHKAPKESEFTLRGQELLMESKQRRRAIESNPQKKTKGTVTRNLNEESRNLRQHITDLAVKTNLLSGKVSLY